MRRLAFSFFAVCFSCACMADGAQAQAIAIEASQGTHYLRLDVDAAGKITIASIDSYRVPTSGGGGGGDDGTGGGGDGLSGPVARAAHDAIAKVTGDAEREINAQMLAVAFRLLGEQIGTTFTPEAGAAPWSKLSQATKLVQQRLLGTAHAAWTPWNQAVSAELAKLEAAGKLATAEQMRLAYFDIAAGLEYTDAAEARRAINPETIQLILKLVMMILEMFFKV